MIVKLGAKFYNARHAQEAARRKCTVTIAEGEHQRRCIAMGAKFQAGQRVVANEKAPGDYEGHSGTVLAHHPPTYEYQVQFDGDGRGPGWLASWQLDLATRAA